MRYFHLDINRMLIGDADSPKDFIRKQGDIIVKAEDASMLPSPNVRPLQEIIAAQRTTPKNPKPCCG